MTVGSKSLLFGVHAFWWHPIVVLLGWLRLYRSFPTIGELIAIVLHDIGYWGCADMDGEQGLYHPVRGARFAAWVTRGVDFLYHPEAPQEASVYSLAMFHSSSLAERLGVAPSKLCAADKCSILFEPWWFYSLRARLSGELGEYVANGPKGLAPREWFRWLQQKFKTRYETSTQSEDIEPHLRPRGRIS